MGYQNRRYRMNAEGGYEKRWDSTDEPGWFPTKKEAMEYAARPAPSDEPKPKKAKKAGKAA